MTYDKRLISRIKGALRAGLGPKVLSHLTGIPHETIKEWATEARQAAVEADTSVLDDVRLALLKEN